MNKKIGIIGCGNMGEALIRGMMGGGFSPKAIFASDIRKERLNYIKKKAKVNIFSDGKKIAEKCSVIIIAVKPKDIKEILEKIRNFLNKKKTLISIAAGISTKFIEKIVGKEIPVIRVMPNTPALVGKGVSAISKGKYAKRNHISIAKTIMKSVGSVFEIKENLMDKVTAISGSGPAYLFYFTEGLIKAAKEFGIPEDFALKTIFGSAKLLEETGEKPEILRKKVTSPGGTTEAAIGWLEKKNWKKILTQAIKKAKEKSKKLGK